MRQQRIEFPVQFDRGGAETGGVPAGIEPQPAHRTHRHVAAFTQGCAPGNRVQPRHQFGHVERFGQIIVRARFQPVDAVLDRSQRAEHQHRGHRAVPSPGAQQVDAVAIGQQPVEHHAVERAFASPGQPLCGIGRPGRLDPRRAQSADDMPGNHRIIFNHQTAQRVAPFCRAPVFTTDSRRQYYN